MSNKNECTLSFSCIVDLGGPDAARSDRLASLLASRDFCDEGCFRLAPLLDTADVGAVDSDMSSCPVLGKCHKSCPSFALEG